MAKTTKKTLKKVVDFSKKTADELASELVSSQNDLVEARRSHAARELVSTARIRQLRKQIARIKTALSHPLASETKEKK